MTTVEGLRSADVQGVVRKDLPIKCLPSANCTPVPVLGVGTKSLLVNDEISRQNLIYDLGFAFSVIFPTALGRSLRWLSPSLHP